MARSLLDDLAGVERRDLVASARRRRFAKGDTLFHEGDPGDALHVVTRGYVAIRATTRLGDVVTLNVLGPGEAFGELALLGHEQVRTASAVALDAVETLSWRGAQIGELRAASVDVDRFLLEVLVEQVTRLSARLVEALHTPVETRVVRRLDDLARLFEPDADTATIPVTQEDLASMAGTTRPTANRVLKELEAAGTVELTRGRITVVDRPSLAKRAAQDR